MTGVFKLFRPAATEIFADRTSFTGHIRDFINQSNITKVTIGCSSDRDLSLKWATPVTRREIESLMSSLKNLTNHVDSLSMLGCLFNGGKAGREDLRAFADALKHNKTLRALEINTTAMDQESRLILHDGLASNYGLKSFTSFSLNEHTLDGKTLVSLNNAILQNPTIENYHFSGDRIDTRDKTSFLKDYSKILRAKPSIKFDNFLLNKDNVAEKLHDHGLQNVDEQEARPPMRPSI
jgi:hypothetical protein